MGGTHHDRARADSLEAFRLETLRLETAYRSLEGRFSSLQEVWENLQLRLAGKWKELEWTTHYLQTVLDHLSQGVVFIDAQGIVTTCNAAAGQLLGLLPEKLLYHRYESVLKEDIFGFSVEEALKGGTLPSPRLIPWKDGREVEVEGIFVQAAQMSLCLESAEGHYPAVNGVLVLLKDLTEMRRLQSREAHREQLKEIGVWASHLAHEIRNPLGGIQGFALLLKGELQDRPVLLDWVDKLMGGIDDLNRVVSQVLDYSRYKEAHLEWVELSKLSEEIKELVQPHCLSPEVHFHCEVHSSGSGVFIDRSLVRSALLNLCMNGIQAMPQGGDLTLRFDVTAQLLTISVSDTGIGIAPNLYEKIFSPFFTTRSVGTGLGLVEVKRAVRIHHGSIRFHSQEGQGSTFIIEIPLVDERTVRNDAH